MFTLFISDLHLDASDEKTVSSFLAFLRDLAPQADALYILGDLFEAWCGDDACDATQQKIIHALYNASRHTPIYVMHGNRDFLLGTHFAKESGCELIPDPHAITLYGKKIVLMHGDTLCTLDVHYQKMRRWFRNRWIQKIFLSLPVHFRQKLTQGLRHSSQKHVSQLDSVVMDITPSALATTFQTENTTCVIHGHTHQPSLHYLDLSTTPKQHIVLGDWHHGKTSVLFIHDDGRVQLS